MTRDYQEKLDVVNEDDEIIGSETRAEIHRQGLRHREVHIWIYNDKGEVLFQKRADDKDTFPGLYDVSVGGHVDLGRTYEDMAVQELEEETGIKAEFKDLDYLASFRFESQDLATNTRNNTFKKVYAYKFTGKPEDIVLEDGKATDLKFISVDQMFGLSEEEKKKFTYGIFDKRFLDTLKQVKELAET